MVGVRGRRGRALAELPTVSNRHWHHGNVVLVGDSAHTAHFSAGLGSTLAIGDAIALAAQLRRVGYRAAAMAPPA